jgi:alpha/beta superfamily hydrolase
MNNQVVYNLYYAFAQRKFSVLRCNFRGVGRSQGLFDNGPGELADAATALDWLQIYNPDAKSCWIAGVSFGAWIGMQLLMRRPEIEGFICVAPPPSNVCDFSFLAPCPSSGLIINGDIDRVSPPETVKSLADKLKTQRGITITHEVISGANHFFEDKIDELITSVGGYLDRRLEPPKKKAKKIQA